MLDERRDKLQDSSFARDDPAVIISDEPRICASRTMQSIAVVVLIIVVLPPQLTRLPLLELLPAISASFRDKSTLSSSNSHFVAMLGFHAPR